MDLLAGSGSPVVVSLRDGDECDDWCQHGVVLARRYAAARLRRAPSSLSRYGSSASRHDEFLTRSSRRRIYLPTLLCWVLVLNRALRTSSFLLPTSSSRLLPATRSSMGAASCAIVATFVGSWGTNEVRAHPDLNGTS